MENKKGITLVALIITIIVMVILAGVAISAILPEDGVINKTETASIETEKKQMLEQISTCAIYGTNGKIKVKETYENTEELYGQDKVILRFPFEETEINSETEEIILTVQGKYTDCNYRITTTIIEIYNGELPQPQQNYEELKVEVGDVVYYDSNLDGDKEEWIVYTKSEDSKTMEIISANTMYDNNGNGLTLGKSDPYLPSNIIDYDCDGVAGDDKDKAIESYNSAIATINRFCQEIITAKNSGVRSVGATPAEDKSEMCMLTYFCMYFPGKVGEESQIKNNDGYHQKDLEKMKKLGGKNIAKTSNAKSYWIASRTIHDSSSSMYFDVRYINTSGSDKYTYPWYMNKSETSKKVYAKDWTYGVRPIVTNPINISLEP